MRRKFYASETVVERKGVEKQTCERGAKTSEFTLGDHVQLTSPLKAPRQTPATSQHTHPNTRSPPTPQSRTSTAPPQQAYFLCQKPPKRPQLVRHIVTHLCKKPSTAHIGSTHWPSLPNNATATVHVYFSRETQLAEPLYISHPYRGPICSSQAFTGQLKNAKRTLSTANHTNYTNHPNEFKRTNLVQAPSLRSKTSQHIPAPSAPRPNPLSHCENFRKESKAHHQPIDWWCMTRFDDRGGHRK